MSHVLKSAAVFTFSYLTEILSGDAVVITTGQLVHECEHLVFGSDELWLGGTAQEGKLRWLPKAQASKVNKNTRGQNMWNCNSCNKPYYTGKCVLASWLQVHMAPHRGIWSPTRGKVILIWLHFSLSPPHSSNRKIRRLSLWGTDTESAVIIDKQPPSSNK